MSNFLAETIDFFLEDQQVTKNRQRVSSDLKDLQKFQRNNLSLNLNQELLASSSLISSLENKLIDLKLQLAVLKRQFIDQEAPEIINQESQIEELKKQIQEERNLLVSPSGKNFGEKELEWIDYFYHLRIFVFSVFFRFFIYNCVFYKQISIWIAKSVYFCMLNSIFMVLTPFN